MLYKIFCLVAMVLTAPVMVFFWDKMLTPDEKKSSRPGRLLFSTAIYFPLAAAKIFLGSALWLPATYGVYIIGMVLLLRRGYRESMLVKIIAWIILVSLSIIADGIYEGVYYLVYGAMIVVDYSQPYAAFACMMVLLITVPLDLFAAQIWNKAYKKRSITENTGILLLFCVLPVCIFVMGMLTLSHAGSSEFFPYLMICSSLAFMAIMMIFVLLIQFDRAAVQKELAEIQRQSELERAHYAAVEEKREALARIRHDYRNVLNAALILMEGGNQEKAKQLLAELTERISATSEHPFCAIPVINAVLTEKKTVCDRQGILLRPELLLPEALSVDDFDLCIILGNLIDNAIRACGGKNAERKPEASPEIRLSAGVVQGYLVVRCENPVFPETEDKKGTGYGQKILKSLAEKYQGDFLTQKQDGSYTAQISLLLEKERTGEIGAKTGETGKYGTP